MKLGYMAVSQYGTRHHLTEANKHPRGQLLRKCGSTHAEKMYVDGKDGSAKHIGYIVGQEWYTVYEVHGWEGYGEEMETEHTPDRVHNPSSPCGCYIMRNGKAETLHYCTMHAAAPDMLAALEFFANLPEQGKNYSRFNAARLAARSAIAKAMGAA